VDFETKEYVMNEDSTDKIHETYGRIKFIST